MKMHYYPVIRRLKKKIADFIGCWQHNSHRKRLARKKIDVPEDSIVLSYGPGIGEQLRSGVDLTGGKVKLTYLHQRFPHTAHRFNVLYLVSSALPKYPVLLVQWAKAHGIKVVLNQNGVAYPAWTNDHRRINTELRDVMKTTNLIIYQSDFCKKAVHQLVGLAPPMHAVINNCVDIEKFYPRRKNQNANIRLLVAGSHYQKERVTIPLHVLKMLLDRGVNAYLDIAGPLKWLGAEDEVASMVKRLQLTRFVDVSGAYSYRHSSQLYSQADILLHLKYKDPCPNTVIEALSCGVAVIGSNSGGMAELVGEKAGILLPVEDSWDQMMYPSIGNTTDAVLKVMGEIETYCVAARCRAEKQFAADKWIDQHEELFSKLLGRVG